MLERVKMYREIDLDLQTTGSMLYVYTDQPNGLALRDTIALNTAGLRAPVNLRLQAMTGQHFQVKIVGPAVIYQAKVCLRILGAVGSWVWVQIPLRRTPEGFVSSRLPIRPTGDWQTLPLPFLGYDRDWRWVQLPVDAIE